MDAQSIVRHIGSEKLHRLDAEDPDEFERTIGAYIDPDEDYESIRTGILELIGAENPPLTGDDLDMFIQGVKEESKQNTGDTKVRITESRLREIVKEEISALHEKATPFAPDDDPRYDKVPQIVIRRFPDKNSRGQYVVFVSGDGRGGAPVYGGPKGGLGRGWYSSAPRHPKDLTLASFVFFLEEAHDDPATDFSHELDPNKVKRVDVSMELDEYAEWQASFNASGVVGSPKIKFIKSNFDN